MQISYLNNKNRLNGIYLETFELIENYCKASVISADDFEDCMGYLVDIFVSAQADQVPVKKITGDNIENFCKSFLKSTMPGGICRYVLQTVKNWAWTALFFMLTACFLLYQDAGLWKILHQSSDVLMCFLFGVCGGVGASIISNLVVRRLIFKVKKYRKVYSTVINAVVLIAVCAAMFTGLNFNETFIQIPNWIGLAACSLYLLFYYAVRTVINIRQGRSPFSNRDFGYKAPFSTGLMTAMVSELQRNYDKTNAKRAKKGMCPLTQEEYTEKIFNDTKKQARGTLGVCLGCGMFYVAAIVYTALDSTPTDTLLFAALIGVIYIIIMYPMVIYPFRVRKKLTEYLAKNKKSIFDEDLFG